MKVPLSWLRDFVDAPADPAAVAARLDTCGFAVEGIEGETIDVEVTANRPDCLSVRGLAREVATALAVELTPDGAPLEVPAAPAPVPVSIDDRACGRYALAVADVTVGPSPGWLASRLVASGVRPINAIVDVTNYVMLETGQPMHAFDLDRLGGPEITVRRARTGEQLDTLDGETRVLDASMLVIADRDRPVAIAGVMGGVSSEVSATTRRVAFESAWFAPATVRATSRRLGLKTEASARFERGADPNAPVRALLRALALVAEIGAGRISAGLTDVVTDRPVPPSVRLRQSRLDRLLGAGIPDDAVQRILRSLGFDVMPTDDGWQIVCPSFRVDVSREADLVEEVGRHWGFDRVAPRFPALASIPRTSSPAVRRGRHVRSLLCGAGVQEAATFTFIEAAAAAPFAADGDAVVITNPLSEKFAVLRPSLVPGLVEPLEYNRNRQADAVRLFEVGSVFSRSRGERPAVAWVLCGPRGQHWSERPGEQEFTDARGLAEVVALAFGVEFEAEPSDDLAFLVAGQRAVLLAGDRRLGWLGRVAGTDPGQPPVFAGELDLAALEEAAADRPTTIVPLPRFPSAVRDLSVLVDERLPATDVRGTIRSNAPATLVDVREFDRYQGRGVPDGQVSLSLRLTFQSADRTLHDAEVQQAVDRIVAALATAHQATLRGRSTGAAEP